MTEDGRNARPKPGIIGVAFRKVPPLCGCAGGCASSTRSGDARAEPIHSRTFDGHFDHLVVHKYWRLRPPVVSDLAKRSVQFDPFLVRADSKMLGAAGEA